MVNLEKEVAEALNLFQRVGNRIEEEHLELLLGKGLVEYKPIKTNSVGDLLIYKQFENNQEGSYSLTSEGKKYLKK